MKFQTYLFLIFFIALLNSCASLYIPNSVNTPLFTERNEATINANVGMNGWDLQAAYSPIKHVGIMVNSSGSPKLRGSNSSFHSHAFLEGALGFSSRVGEKGVIELYAGAGQGNIETRSKVIVNNNAKYDQVKGEGTRLFIQPSFGLKSSESEFSFSLRCIYNDLINVSYDNSTDLVKRSGTFIEPTVTLRRDKGKIMLQSQVGASIPFNLSSNNIRLRPFILSVGICYRIGKKVD